MVLVWILLALLVSLVAWAAWRQKRYGATSAYDRDRLIDWHHSDYNPWGVGNETGKKDPDR